MKVVLMAGGRGTRISELFPDVPKPLIPIQNMPVLEREIISLREQGFTEIILTVERYLRQCLDSLINQTYNELEVIMVDDGSKDSSGKICDEYSEKYDNFKVVHKENAGLGMARNTGFEHIKGEYVTFVDSDDYLEPDCIATLYNELRNKDVDMCKGGFKRVIDSGKIVSNRIYDNELFQGEKAKKEMLPRMIGSSPTKHDSIEMCVCGALYNTKPIFEHNLRFPSERELISEDLVFNIDYMQYANGACTIDKAGYNYRVNLGSLSTSYRKDRFEASYLLMIVGLIKKNIKNNNIYWYFGAFVICLGISLITRDVYWCYYSSI